MLAILIRSNNIYNAYQNRICYAKLMSKSLLVWGYWYYGYYWSVSSTWSHRNWFNWVYVWLYWNGGLCYIFWHGLFESLLIQWQEFIDFVLWQQILNSLEWTISVSRSQRQESFFNLSTCLQTVQHCCHTAFEHCRSWETFLSSCLNQNQPQS